MTKLSSLPSWSDVDSAAVNDENKEKMKVILNEGENPPFQAPPFAINSALNRKIQLWKGPIWELTEVEAIVNTSNESLTDLTGIAKSICAAAGPEIKIECAAVSDRCRTGEAVSTRGCQLHSKRIIHTVAPKYSLKYHNAAENALFGCYRSCMRVAIEEDLRSIAFCCIYTMRKGYPRDQATHIAIRTVRRMLEHFSDDIDNVLFCVDTAADYDLYLKTLPLYFPRNEEEEIISMHILPKNLGNEYGEPIIGEREIRISPNLPSFTEPYDNQNDDDHLYVFENEEQIVDDFCDMTDNPDEERIHKIRTKKSKNPQSRSQLDRYQDCLRRSYYDNFSDVEKLNLIYRAGIADKFNVTVFDNSCEGTDHRGFPIFAYIAENFPMKSENLDHILRYIVQTINASSEQKYSVVYIHSDKSNDSQTEVTWLKKLFKTFSSKYRKNLVDFFVVYPTTTLKMVLWFVKTFVSASFYCKVTYLDELQDIYELTPSLDLPGKFKPIGARNEEENCSSDRAEL